MTDIIANQEVGSNRYRVPIFSEINIEKDIEYGEVKDYQGNNLSLLLDLYTPAGDAEKNRPTIFFIHGGGFKIGKGKDKTQNYIVTLANEFTKRGYVSIVIDYRVRPNPEEDWLSSLKDAVSDAMLALDWVRQNSLTYGIDKERIAICGGSAGGMMGVNLCSLDWNKKGIMALVNLWGSPDPRLMLGSINKNTPPTLIIHATQDPQVSFSWSEKLVQELKDKGVYHVLHSLEGAGHPPKEHMDKIIDYMTDFLYQVLIPPKN